MGDSGLGFPLPMLSGQLIRMIGQAGIPESLESSSDSGGNFSGIILVIIFASGDPLIATLKIIVSIFHFLGKISDS